jgi:formate C-acetyltransferase
MGPTLSLHSTTSWQPYRFLGGISVNQKLSSNVSDTVIEELINGYIKEQGVQLQFNIVKAEDLKKAQLFPEQYGDLLVRIGGYSDYFVRIPKGLQDDIISRTQN